MKPNPVKRALKAGQPSVGTWLSLGSITAARFMARAGFAWLTVDIEHSLVDWETATHMFATVADAGCTALARVPANRHDHIKRVLDNGAHGVVVPMVNSRQEAEDAVSAMLYPPAGTRSVGGSVHSSGSSSTSTTTLSRCCAISSGSVSMTRRTIFPNWRRDRRGISRHYTARPRAGKRMLHPVRPATIRGKYRPAV